jgi:hypothetical protein
VVPVVVGVVAAVAIVADFVVCADVVAIGFWEGLVSVLACVTTGVLSLVFAVVPSVRLETV